MKPKKRFELGCKTVLVCGMKLFLFRLLFALVSLALSPLLIVGALAAYLCWQAYKLAFPVHYQPGAVKRSVDRFAGKPPGGYANSPSSHGPN